MRFLSIVFFLGAAIAFAADVAVQDPTGLRLRSIGEIWFTLHRESLLLVQPALERHVHEDLYFTVVEPVLQQPATLVLAGVGVVFLALWALGRLRRRAA